MEFSTPQGIIYICPISWRPCFTVDGTQMDSKWHSELIKSINEEKRFEESDAVTFAETIGEIPTYFECMFANDVGECLIHDALVGLAKLDDAIKEENINVAADISGEINAYNC